MPSRTVPDQFVTADTWLDPIEVRAILREIAALRAAEAAIDLHLRSLTVPSQRNKEVLP